MNINENISCLNLVNFEDKLSSWLAGLSTLIIRLDPPLLELVDISCANLRKNLLFAFSQVSFM